MVKIISCFSAAALGALLLGASVSHAATSAPLHSFTGTGWHLLSSPYTISQTFASMSVTAFSYDAATQSYVDTPTPPADTFHPGYGYWIYLRGTSLDIPGPGTPASTSAPFSITLGKGWNLVGDPFTTPAALSTIQVVDPSGSSTDYATAISNHLVGPLFVFNSATQSYNLLSVGADILNPWDGAWVYAQKAGAALVFGAPAGASNYDGVYAEQDVGWTVPVTPATTPQELTGTGTFTVANGVISGQTTSGALISGTVDANGNVTGQVSTQGANPTAFSGLLNNVSGAGQGGGVWIVLDSTGNLTSEGTWGAERTSGSPVTLPSFNGTYTGQYLGRTSDTPPQDISGGAALMILNGTITGQTNTGVALSGTIDANGNITFGSGVQGSNRYQYTGTVINHNGGAAATGTWTGSNTQTGASSSGSWSLERTAVP